MEPTTEIKTNEKQIVDNIMGLKKSYEESTSDARAEIGEIFNNYMGKLDNVVQAPYDTKETIPKLRTEIAYIKPFIFSGEPEVEFEGIGDEDKVITKIYEKIVNHRFRTIPQFYDKVESWAGQGVGFGTSEIKVLWRFEQKKMSKKTAKPFYKRLFSDEKFEDKEYLVTIKDEPDVEVPNHLDVYYNPIIPSIQDQKNGMLFRSVLPVATIKNDSKYDYKDALGNRNADKLEETEGSIKNDTYSSTSLMGTDIPNAQEKATKGMVEVFELITEDRIQTVANGLLLRDIENPYGFINAVKFGFEPNIIPNRYDMIGVGQNTLGLGKMIYKMMNQAMMNVKLGNNPMYLYRQGSVKDKSQFVSKPGGGIEVNNDGRSIKDSIDFVQFPDLSQGFFNILNKIDDEHKRASGGSDLVQGSASNDTLGQDELVQQNISNRFELIVRRFKNALAEVADMMLRMELHNLQSPDAEILRIFPQEARQGIYELLISEKDNVKYNVRIKGETNVARNKNLESKRLVELFNVASSVQTEIGPLLTNKELRAILRKGLGLQGEQNIDDLVGEEAPQPAIPQAMPQGNPNETTSMPQSMPQMPDQQVMPQ